MVLYLYQQMRRDYKIKFTDKSKANLWIHLDLAKVHHLKGLTSPCIIYLHFLNLNTILTLPQTLFDGEAQLFKSFEFGNGSRISDENLVILEFKYLQNKKW